MLSSVEMKDKSQLMAHETLSEYPLKCYYLFYTHAKMIRLTNFINDKELKMITYDEISYCHFGVVV